MKNAYIKFQTEKDHALGYAELTTHSAVSRLSGDVFCIPWGSLTLLDRCKASYTFATEDDLSDAHPVWVLATGFTR